MKTSVRLKYCSKNTLHSRKSSIQYYVANSLHRLYTPQEYLQEGHNDLMKSKRCIYCGIEFSTVQKQTIDHIFPLMTDGQPTQKMVLCYQNLGLCCSACNSSKSNKCHEQWMLNKQYSTNRLVLINEQVDLVPTFSDEIYQLILMKYKTFMTNHLHNLKELVLL